MTADTPVRTASPFHAGEIQMQRSVGVAERMDAFGRRVIRDHMPDQHRSFFQQLPFVVVGTVDRAGDAWATLATGEPGFITSPDARTLSIAAARDANDPADLGLGEGAAIGLLGIELHSRRRNRMNGHMLRFRDGGFDVRVEHSFGNCPQYIQQRRLGRVAGGGLAAPIRAERLADVDRETIAAADTFFVASYIDHEDGGRQVDVSHRGGKAGFVRIEPDGSLTIPDFAGNLHFNTLGNFLLNPRAGLLFADFVTGDVLQLSGDAEVVLESPEIAAFQGAERLWRFRPRVVVRRPAANPLRGDLHREGWSPNSLMTGSWEDAAGRLAAEATRSSWRSLRVVAIVDESPTIRSFHLAPIDGAGLVAFAAGQHLPIRLPADARGPALHRTYTLSVAPSDEAYRISVKRQGPGSARLHDSLRVGDVLKARAPAGAFTIDASARRPAVLVAAGVGITPILAMLRHLVFEGLRTRRVRPTWLFYAARTLAERAFDAEIRELVQRSGGEVRLFRLLASSDGAEEGRDYDALGRLDADLFRRVLSFGDHDFYLCGPPAFMQGVYDGLRGMDVPDARVHAESFGPSALVRHPDLGTTIAPARPVATTSMPVAFAASAKEARWTPGSGSLLDLAERRGLTPDFGCRTGGCGACRTRILEGAVAYAVPPTAPVEDGEALICCAQPAGGSDRLILDL